MNWQRLRRGTWPMYIPVIADRRERDLLYAYSISTICGAGRFSFCLFFGDGGLEALDFGCHNIAKNLYAYQVWDCHQCVHDI